MTSGALRLTLRAIAVAIAIAAALDPAVTTNRPSKPVVAVVPAHARDSSRAARVAASLDKRFTVVRAPLSIADASVIVGDNLPPAARDLASPVFTVLRDPGAAAVALQGIQAPSIAPTTARVPVTAAAHATGARGRTLIASLRDGELVVDRATRTIRSDDERLSIPLTFVPAAPGAARLRVTAAIEGSDSTTADVAVDVRDTRWAVLVYDPRPSWMSRFTRRALERDPRFVVTSRVVTSRNVSSDAGRPPARLNDLAATGVYDAIVIGAPESLTDVDVSGLETYLRRRGGSVVLLLDHRAPGPYERLAGVAQWTSDSTGKAEMVAGGATSDSLRAAELVWPTSLPGGGEIVASTKAGAHPVVWSSHVGAGRLIVSGALDAWRFRDPSSSSFDRFWQTLVADAASASLPPLVVSASSRVVAPRERVQLTVLARDAALSDSRPVAASATASLVSNRGSENVRLWPDDRAGTFTGSARVPATPGVYRLAVAVSGARAELPIIVASDASSPAPDAIDLVRAWVASRGGVALAATDAGSLASRLAAAIHPAERPVTWHPMRSAWWILPFAFALAAEWWLRRRRGLL